MATPKIDSIIAEFGKRIAMQATFSGGILQDYSSQMTASTFMAYVNRAMNGLFKKYWAELGGDVDKFIQVFPELSNRTDTPINMADMSLAGNFHFYYDKASPLMDMHAIISVVDQTRSKRVQMLPPSYYSGLLSKELPHFNGSLDRPLGVYVGNRLSIFNGMTGDPADVMYAYITYIQAPLNPTDGSLLVQNGDYDSPFSDIWGTEIAEIAESLFKVDSQQSS